jgi:glucan biosynthesis protein C
MSDDRRYYGLDALRGGMMMLGIVLHSATVYLAAPPPHVPLVTDPNNSLVMDAIFDFIHSFRMPTFFVLAGFFASLLVEKRGLKGAYLNRLARIAAPFAAAMLTILPLTMFFFLDFILSARYGVHGLLPDRRYLARFDAEMAARHVEGGIPTLHLWFLLYLCYFYLLIPLCRMLVRWSLPVEAKVGRFLASPWSLPVFALYTAATLWPYPGGQVFGSFIFLGFSPAAVLYYGSFFVIGYVVHHYRAATQHLIRRVPWCAGFALVLFPLSIYASHLEYTHDTAEIGYHVLAIGLHALCTWVLIWFFVGLALRYFDRPTPWALYASQSSYWVFLLHMPVISIMAWLLVPVDVSALVKFTVVAAVTTVVCFTTYHYWVQDSWMGAFLNGKRFQLDWPWRPQAGRTR